MIKTLLALTAILASSTYANILFACESVQRCGYDSSTETYSDCSETLMTPSMFELSDAGKVFTHTTAEMSSTYYIKSSNYSEADSILYMVVISDAGNRYTYAFSVMKKRVVAQGVDSEGNKFMVIFEAKNIINQER